MALIQPHCSRELKPLLLEDAERAAELKKAGALPQLRMTPRETADVIADLRRPEVPEILRDYYQGLDTQVGTTLQGDASGDALPES